MREAGRAAGACAPARGRLVRGRALCLAAALLPALAGRGAAQETRDAAKIPPVPKGHPRVYVRPADLPAIRAKLSRPEFARSWKVVRETAARRSGEGVAFCSAFVYLVGGDAAQGRKAVQQALEALRGSRNRVEAARTFRTPMHWAACVYDWCYDLLSDQQKQAFVREFERIAAMRSPGYPARPQAHAIVGHGAEGWLLTGQLPAGVAIHDEQPRMYAAAARLFFDEFVPVRDYHYAAHMHHQGSHYATRLIYDLAAAWLFRRMGAGDVFSRELHFVPYEHLYHLRPDGQQLRRGDSSPDTRTGRRWGIMTLAAAYYRDGYLLAARDAGHWFNHCHRYNEVFDLLLRPAGLKARPASELPQTKYFPEPMGEMVARTGWRTGPDSRDAVVHMRIGGAFFGNHQCLDMGTFQIYFRGPLAPTSGSYQGGYGTAHWRCYLHQTLAGNGLLIFDPQERLTGFRRANDGGQRLPNDGADHPRDLETLLTRGYVLGRVTGRGFGPEPLRSEYSYIAGDITKAYGPKARLVTRSMVALDTRDETYPCVLIVFDRVESSDPSFRKTWLLHSVQAPSIAGGTVTVTRTGRSFDGRGRYGGKLEVRSLLPADRTIRKIGGPGREFWVESTQRNYPVAEGRLYDPSRGAGEPGAWRVEVSPAGRRASDRFLHVLTVMDADVPAGPAVRTFGDAGVVGVAVLDRAVVFARDARPMERAAFALPDGGERGVLVCDLAPGRWRVSGDGKVISAGAAVPVEAASLYFRASARHYVLTRVDKTVPPSPREDFWDRLRRSSLEARPAGEAPPALPGGRARQSSAPRGGRP